MINLHFTKITKLFALENLELYGIVFTVQKLRTLFLSYQCVEILILDYQGHVFPAVVVDESLVDVSNVDHGLQ